MLVVAMAFAWCVISAEQAGRDQAPRSAAPLRRAPRAQARRAAAPIEGQRTRSGAPFPLDVIEFAKTLVNMPMGAEQVQEIDGQRYVFVLERHYHPPGFVGAPSGFHKGVTAYELH